MNDFKYSQGMVCSLYGDYIRDCPIQRLYPHSIYMKGSVTTCVNYILTVASVIPHMLINLIFHQMLGVGDFGYSGHDTWLVCVCYIFCYPIQRLYTHSICMRMDRNVTRKAFAKPQHSQHTYICLRIPHYHPS